MNYRSVTDMSGVVRRLAREIGPVDRVVGVPRSGMLAATLFSLHANVELWDLEGFISQSGPLGKGLRELDIPNSGKTLVLDDSANSGREIDRVRLKLADLEIDSVILGAVFVSPEAVDKVDVFGEKVALPRVFEWNVLNHPAASTWCFDIDGVLCEDPPFGEEDEADAAYLNHLSHTSCWLRPGVELGVLVSNRLERHREITESWLRESGIEFRELFLRPEATAAERRESGGYGAFKAQHYKDSDAQLFIESDRAQATDIARLTRRPVYCVDTREMIYGSNSNTGEPLVTPTRLQRANWNARARARQWPILIRVRDAIRRR